MIRALHPKTKKYSHRWEPIMVFFPRIVRLECGKRMLVACEHLERRRSHSGRGWLYRIP
jgi:hypothetical protein